MSPIGIMFMVCTFAFMLLLFFKLGPHYMDYYGLRSVFDQQANLPDIKTQNVSKIQSDLGKTLIINNYRNFNPATDATITIEDGILTMGFEYEVREHMIANVDVLLTFSHSIEIEVE